MAYTSFITALASCLDGMNGALRRTAGSAHAQRGRGTAGARVRRGTRAGRGPDTKASDQRSRAIVSHVV
eukprot:5482180-Prymnesium_polylepis.1